MTDINQLPEFSSDELDKISDIIFSVQDKVLTLKRSHERLGVAKMNIMFYFENTNLNDDKKEILKGKCTTKVQSCTY